ncbi:ubiquinone/menaquinone biosynthesis C-methylase UbiE [Nocardia transvalensis]|uniref:Ubiquinone/menaquinone biosynthesis C-methylase UbiE n=1 Tax=Nocardia transvalensis TaxID=37333 RepID=A0A7W9PLK1_9NOCA|nr:class I SAM-dependent methyltransferase [Nocardia transvalensis]MBB5918145.1 ubiquinone/menaquinone biosynthesis C-methylase UbiE [Nocardia transvalensis]
MDTPPVNHHAGHPGFAGPIGTAMGLYMFLAGRQRARMVADLASVTSADTVVDIGCGPGGGVAAAARHGARVTGVDPSTAMLRLARILVRGNGIGWTQGVAERLPLEDGAATVAWAVATVHHWPDVTGGLAEIHRVLAPGGRFLAMERDVAADAKGLASHGWTETQARSFADHCRAADLTDPRVEGHVLGRRMFWTVSAIRP